MPYRLRVRRFLNLKGFHAGAYILAEVENSTSRRDTEWPFVDISLVLADCDRVVSFDFNVDSPAARRNSLRKLDIMIDTLIQFREALAAEANLAAARERKSAAASKSANSRR